MDFMKRYNVGLFLGMIVVCSSAFADQGASAQAVRVTAASFSIPGENSFDGASEAQNVQDQIKHLSKKLIESYLMFVCAYLEQDPAVQGFFINNVDRYARRIKKLDPTLGDWYLMHLEEHCRKAGALVQECYRVHTASGKVTLPAFAIGAAQILPSAEVDLETEVKMVHQFHQAWQLGVQQLIQKLESDARPNSVVKK